ncbi:MAG: RimK family alpha-L-glutamate ligase [Pigmentiphaga sp.]
MSTKFYVLDERHVWHAAIIEAANSRGFEGVRIFRGEDVDEAGYGFIRCHAEPNALKRNQSDYDLMAHRLQMVQDEAQVRVYEDKSAQFARWAHWMPPTWRFTSGDLAMQFLETADYPIVSKADVGASSVNVRILESKAQAQRHVHQVFTTGIAVKHCAGRAQSIQRGYALLQRFIPHQVTWRVNVIGSRRAAFMRYCYPDRAVAQTGNVDPVMEMTPQVESLFDFCDRFADEARTKWCALDVLQDGDTWRLLETSLAWPWPSPGKCNEAPIFGSGKRWIQLFDVMLDEIEAGTW